MKRQEDYLVFINNPLNLIKMENLQLLNKEQISSIIEILERDYIDPRIKEAREAITTTDEFKEQFNELKKLVNSDIFKKYLPFKYSDEDLKDKVLNKNKVRSHWSINNNIQMDLIARLRVTEINDFNIIIENIINYIDVDKYLYEDESSNKEYYLKEEITLE